MLLIIHLMLFLSIYQDEAITCYFTAGFQKARFSAGQGRPWLFFLCFIRQLLRFTGDSVIGSAQAMRPLSRDWGLL